MDYDEEQPPTPTTRLANLENDIEELCRSMKNEEVSEQELQDHFLDFSPEQLKSVVNRMIKAMKLQVKPDGPIIRLRDNSIIKRLQGLDEDEIKTYEAIEAVGNKGIASRYLRIRAGKLSTTRIAKILQTLETKMLIKAVKLQKSANRASNSLQKMYMLAHLQPDEASVGKQTVYGVGTMFDVALFETVSKVCVVELKKRMKEFLQRDVSPDATAEEILAAVVESGAVKSDLTEGSIEAALKMMELNGKVERRVFFETDGEVVRYRLHTIKTDKPEAALPCVGCPVKHLCSFNTPINPIDCPHFDTWIKTSNF
ncbi:DNA-directed RNA polymerase III subunit RPC6-like [Paramacrobiotus metropolitanus]|uniref:DNA-directed RNA polymerase III subunit RPC6-like n=1 Tax=Paramacrobiotus metropolitanus TaxID=2943436 RepID=UPI002445DF00|nr:DNA-directed RNA polymerase III subunit RPC6-like [Paramacrobiotus metropolitanus]